MATDTESTTRPLERVHVLVPPEVNQKMRDIAVAEDRPMTRVFRQAIVEFVERHEEVSESA